MRHIAVLLAALALAGAAAAHDPSVGPHGGVKVDAGAYHVELVPTGTRVEVHVTGAADAVVPVEGFTGTAVLLIGGKPQRIALSPAATGVMSGDAGVEVPAGVKGAVQLTAPDGATVTGKF